MYVLVCNHSDYRIAEVADFTRTDFLVRYELMGKN